MTVCAINTETINFLCRERPIKQKNCFQRKCKDLEALWGWIASLIEFAFFCEFFAIHIFVSFSFCSLFLCPNLCLKLTYTVLKTCNQPVLAIVFFNGCNFRYLNRNIKTTCLFSNSLLKSVYSHFGEFACFPLNKKNRKKDKSPIRDGPSAYASFQFSFIDAMR